MTNSGHAFWPAGRWYPYPAGSVTLGMYVPGPQQERVRELGRTTLPRSVSPGETVIVELRVPPEELERGTLAVDLVREGVHWFADRGSRPFVLPAPA